MPLDMHGWNYRQAHYRARYQQLLTATRRADVPLAGAAALLPDDDPADLVALARLHVLNTLLLATAIHHRESSATGGVVCIPYEAAVRNPAAGWHSLTRVLPELAGSSRLPATAPDGSAQAVGEDIFVTTVPKTALTKHLDERSVELVRAATTAALTPVQEAFPDHVTALAVEWLAGDHLYTPAPPAARQSTGRPSAAPAVHHNSDRGRPEYVTVDGLAWRNLLVSNAEYAEFLNELAGHGLHNDSGGAYLLCCEMPHGRGGRLHRDPASGRWTVSPGFENHPAYWVTWIGAAAFAARHGARLPLREEMAALMAGREDSNADYTVGDTVPVMQDGAASGDLHHVVGNVQVWCADGPEAGEGAVSRWLTGAAWNTPSVWEEVARPRHRHLAGSSRGVGIRLVRDEPRRPVPTARLAALLREWMAGLQDRSEPLRALDDRLVTALAQASQADVRLGAHVGARPGPSGLGQPGETRGEADRRQVGERHEPHAADRAGVGALSNGSHTAADASGFERDVDDVGAVTGQVVAHVQQPADGDVDAGLLTHLPHQRVGERLPLFDFSAGQRPGAAGVGVLVKEQNPAVFDHHAGDAHVQHPGNVPHPGAAGAAIGSTRVVVAAGGLGTRVHEWARYLPKEWLPVRGRPGIVHVLEEIAELGPAHVVIVYHPYYEPFAAWARQALTADAHHRYLRSAGRILSGCGALGQLRVEWVAQCGAYADLTSILNGADHLALEGHGEETGEGVYVVFGDNLYPSADPNPLVALRQAPPGVAVLARAYQAGLAQRCGVIVTAPGPGGIRRMVDLVEKPGVRAARALQDTYGGDNLMLLEGRARIDGDFVDFARGHAGGDGGEPKLSLVLAAYARRRPVWVVGTAGEVVDLGAPAALDAS